MENTIDDPIDILYENTVATRTCRPGLHLGESLQYFMDLTEPRLMFDAFKKNKDNVLGIVERTRQFNTDTSTVEIVESIKPLAKFTLDQLKKIAVKIGLKRQTSKTEYVEKLTAIVISRQVAEGNESSKLGKFISEYRTPSVISKKRPVDTDKIVSAKRNNVTIDDDESSKLMVTNLISTIQKKFDQRVEQDVVATAIINRSDQLSTKIHNAMKLQITYLGILGTTTDTKLKQSIVTKINMLDDEIMNSHLLRQEINTPTGTVCTCTPAATLVSTGSTKYSNSKGSTKNGNSKGSTKYGNNDDDSKKDIAIQYHQEEW